MMHAPIAPHDELLRLPEVLARVGLSRAMVYRLERQGRFPKRVKINASSRWSRLEVQAWVAERVSTRKAA